MPTSVERAQPLLRRKSVIFVAVHPEGDETLGDVSRGFKSLQCEALPDAARGVVVVFPPHNPAPAKLGA